MRKEGLPTTVEPRVRRHAGTFVAAQSDSKGPSVFARILRRVNERPLNGV